MPSPVPSNVGPYQIDSKIAEGGMAEVFLAYKMGADGWKKRVALKRILPPYADLAEFRKFFKNEANVICDVQHPNVVQVFDYLEFDGAPWIVQEYVDGRTLQNIVKGKRKGMDWRLVAFVGSEILRALQFIHELKPPLLHHDISPENIVIGREGHIKLIDFGIAEVHSKLESQREVKGKRSYLPQAYLQSGVYSVNTELFSLGAVLSGCVAGALPVDLPRFFEERPTDVPDAFVNFLCKSTVAGGGFDSAKSMRAELKSIIKQCGAQSHTQGALKSMFAKVGSSSTFPQPKTPIKTAKLPNGEQGVSAGFVKRCWLWSKRVLCRKTS